MLREIQEELRFTKADLGRELQLDSRTIEKMLVDSGDNPWRLDRDGLSRYIVFAHKYGFEPFRFETHPIWKNFENSEVSIFRGPMKSDDQVERHLVQFLELLHCEVQCTTVPNGTNGIENSLRDRSCVIIGSPKTNPACEVALALLWGGEPFNDDEKNRNRIPVSLLGMPAEKSSALLRESSRHGFIIQPLGSKERGYLKVNWLPPERFGPYQGTGQDAAVLAVCHRPIEAKRDVTTIVIAGYTGLSTLVAAQEATGNKLPDIKPEEESGIPCLMALKFLYQKRPQRGRSLDSLRRCVEGSAEWAPPWKGFFQ